MAVPEDKGGLKYKIEVDATAAFKTIDDFKAKLGLAADQGMAEFGKAATAAAAASKNLTDQTSKGTDEFGSFARSVKESGKTLDDHVESLSSLTRATNKDTAERKRNADSINKAIVAQEKGFDNAQRQISDLEAHEIALKRLTKVQNEARIQKQGELILDEKGVKNKLEQLRSAGLLSEAQKQKIADLKQFMAASEKADQAARNIQIREERAFQQAQAREARARGVSEEKIKKDLAAAEAKQEIAIQTTEAEQKLARTQAATAATKKIIADPKAEESKATGFLGLFQKIRDGLLSTDNAVNRTSFTFRRLFGILAAFTIARNVVAQFGNLITSMISLNAEIETVKLGIASVFTATGDVFNSSGKLVTGVEALNLAQGEAARQLQLLRKEGLSTTATFQELATTFENSVGPGLAAGLNPDQIRKFTISITQAASAIGLAQNQLAEETRSILQGTVSAKNTRIARVLGITNEDIKNAKEAGTLFELLEKKFKAFAVAGEEAQKTFGGLFKQLLNTLQLTIIEGGASFFETFKKFVSDLKSALGSTNTVTGLFEVRPEAVAAVAAIGEGLKFALLQARELGAALGFKDIQSIGAAIGNGIKIGAEAAKDVVIVFVTALKVFERLIAILNGIFSIAEGFGEVASKVIGILVATTLLTTAFLKVENAIKNIIKGAVALQASLAVAAVEGFTLASAIAIATGGLSLLAFFAVSLGFSIFAATTETTSMKEEIKKSRKEMEDLLKTNKELPSAILSATDLVEKQAAAIKKLKEEVASTFIELTKAAKSLGTSSGIKSIIDAQFSGVDEERKLLEESNAELKKSTSEIIKLDKERESLKAEGLSNTIKEKETLEKIQLLDEQRVRNAHARIEVLIKEEGDITGRLFNASRLGDTVLSENLATRIGLIRKERNELEKILPSSKARSTDSKEQTFLQGVLNDLIQKRDSLGARITANQFEQTKNLERQAAIHLTIGAAVANRVIVAAEAERIQTDVDTRKIKQQADAFDLIQRARKTGASSDAIATLNEISKLQLDIRLADEQRNRDAKALTKSIEDQAKALEESKKVAEKYGVTFDSITVESDKFASATVEGTVTLEEQKKVADEIRRIMVSINALKQKQLGVEQKNTAEIQFEQDQLEKLNEDARRSAFTFENIGAGLVEGFRKASSEIPSLFQFTANTVGKIIDDFASTTASLISDAFNPNAKESVAQRFGKLMQGISDIIIQYLVKIAIVEAALNLGSIFAGAATSPTPAGDTGGTGNLSLGRSRATGGPAPRGFAGGGIPNMPAPAAAIPHGLPSTDTVPVWTTPGEWIIRASSVAKYGHAVMDAINRGLADPSALKALAGTRGRSAASPSRSPGFALGGLVSDAVQVAKNDSAFRQDASSGSTVGITVVAPSEENLRRLLSGGKNAFLRFIRENKSTIGPALR